MGGEGAMMAMAALLKNNNNLKSKRKERGGLSGSYADVKVQGFPKATPEMLQAIKVKTIADNRKSRVRLIICLSLVIATMIGVYVYVYKVL